MIMDKEQSKTFGTGRNCGKDGCNTILSTYNRGTHCALHEEDHLSFPEGFEPHTIAQDLKLSALA